MIENFVDNPRILKTRTLQSAMSGILEKDSIYRTEVRRGKRKRPVSV